MYPIVKLIFTNNENPLKYHGIIHGHYIVISEGNTFYRVEIAPLLKYLDTSDLIHLRKENAFNVDMLFDLEKHENIECFIIEKECLYMVRSSRKSIHFDITPLISLGIYDKIENLNKSSKSLMDRFNNLNIKFDDESKKSNFEKINSLSLT